MNDAVVSEVIKANKEYHDCVSMVNKDDFVCSMWGIGAHAITREQVEELLSGKCIYFDDGEYAHIVFVEEKEE